MKFTATQRGFYDDSIVEAGETFEAPDHLKCSWAVPAKEYVAEKPETEADKVEKAKEALQGKKKKKKKKSKSKKKV